MITYVPLAVLLAVGLKSVQSTGTGLCEEKGVVPSGGRFRSTDKCNVCVCNPEGRAECSAAYCGTGCRYGGIIYDVGDSFPSMDQCTNNKHSQTELNNQCHCSEDGVFCTEIWCERQGCFYEERWRDTGSNYPSTDGCNTCTCDTDGGSVCTQMPCANPRHCKHDGQYHAVGSTFPGVDFCNLCLCTSAKEVVCSMLDRCPRMQCVDGRAVYHVGERFGKDCNHCLCTPNGKILCEPLFNCTLTDTYGDSQCSYNDKLHDSGAAFSAQDGCNDCVCNHGTVSCTVRTCDASSGIVTNVAKLHLTACILLSYIITSVNIQG